VRRTALLLALALVLPFASRGQEKPPLAGLDSLLDGAVRIYVVDESRCSTGYDSDEGGRWYLIEGEESLERLRRELAAVPKQLPNGCKCGGPDVHYYVERGDGGLKYFGIDCGSFIEAMKISPELKAILLPGEDRFLGGGGGPTYLVDIPLEVEEDSARQAFSAKGFSLLTGGWWNVFSKAYPREFAARMHTERTAEVHLEFDLGSFHTTLPPAPRCPTKPDAIELDEFMQTDEVKRFSDSYFAWSAEARAETDALASEKAKEWANQLGLGPFLVLLETSRMGGVGGGESEYSCECFLRDAKAIRNILAQQQSKGTAPIIRNVEYRSAATQRSKGFYQAALLFPTPPSRKDLAKAKAVLPGIGRVIPLCECRDKPRG